MSARGRHGVAVALAGIGVLLAALRCADAVALTSLYGAGLLLLARGRGR